MLWYDYLAHFVAGAFLANGVPHLAGHLRQQISDPICAAGRRRRVLVLARNVIWGWFNFIIGGVLLRLSFPPLPPPPALSLATMLGVLVMAIFLSRHFGRAQQRPASMRNRMLVRRARIVAFLHLRPVRWRRCQPGRQRHEARGHGLCHARGRYAGADRPLAAVAAAHFRRAHQGRPPLLSLC